MKARERKASLESRTSLKEEGRQRQNFPGNLLFGPDGHVVVPGDRSGLLDAWLLAAPRWELEPLGCAGVAWWSPSLLQ